MRKGCFANQPRNVVAAALSLAAVLVLFAYVSAPGAANGSISTAYISASHPVVSGVVKSSSGDETREAYVSVVFRNSKGAVIATLHPFVGKNGRWQVRIPHGATKTTITVTEFEHRVQLTERVRAGHSIKVTAVFPGRTTGLLPGLFPY
jgi:hypothetical protein